MLGILYEDRKMRILDILKKKQSPLRGLKLAKCCGTCQNFNGGSSFRSGFGCNLQLGKMQMYQAPIDKIHVCKFYKRNEK